MKQIRLSDVTMSTIADAFTTVYEDYVMPVSLTEEQAAQHVAANDISLADSPLWLDDDGSVVGLAMLGVRGDRGWVGGFGIAKPHRGKGLSHQLISAVIERGRTIGLRQIGLEVITTNTAAIRTYQRAGFVHVRDLLILVRRPDARLLDIDTSAVHSAEPDTLLANRPQAAEPPAWQNERASLTGDSRLAGLCVGPDDAPLAMAVYQQPNDTALRIHDLAAIDHDTAQTLLAALIQQAPGASISYINEPEASAALPALFDLGWQEVMRQHEMVIEC